MKIKKFYPRAYPLPNGNRVVIRAHRCAIGLRLELEVEIVAEDGSTTTYAVSGHFDSRNPEK